MPCVVGVEFPERELMAVLSDLLAIPHFTTSRGGTVRKDFLQAVAGELGVENPGSLRKDPLLAACVEAATGAPMPEHLFSPGATVTNEALQAIIDGVVTQRHDMRTSPRDELDASVNLDDPTDERDRELVELRVGQSRDRFRAKLMAAYQERCAVTHCDAVDALEATSITPYYGPAENPTSNGILLRADLARLWNRGVLAVHEVSQSVLLKHHLTVTAYGELSSRKVRLPRLRRDRPAIVALRDHREWCGL